MEASWKPLDIQPEAAGILTRGTICDSSVKEEGTMKLRAMPERNTQTKMPQT